MKFRSNTRGMVHPLMIVLAVVVIAAVGVAAWKVMSNNKNSSTNTAGSSSKTVNNAAVASACQKAINDTNICNFASHYNPNAAYKAIDTNTSSSGGGTLTITSDGKGNSEVSGTSNGSSFDGITLNGATYLKDPTSGSWIKYSSGTSTPTATTNPADSLKVNASDITAGGTISYKSLGTAACGSLTCFKYQIVDTSAPNTTEYVWFDNTNYQLHEFYDKDSSGTNDMTFDYQNVTISTPSPVTDFSAAASGSTGSTYSYPTQ